MRLHDDIIKSESFEDICLMAEKDLDGEWCWKIGCGTCGCINLVTSFLLLIDEKKPYPIYPVECRDLLFSKQEKLQEKIEDVSLDFVMNNCKFNNSLGYLGLALYCTQDIESKNRKLTKKWIPQLIDIMNDGAKEPKFHLEKILSDNKILTWKDMSIVERGCHPVGKRKFKHPFITQGYEITFSNGIKYQGQLKRTDLGKELEGPNGYGLMTFPNGNKFEGNFLDGKFHGKGVYTQVDKGMIEHGYWEIGKLVRETKRQYKRNL